MISRYLEYVYDSIANELWKCYLFVALYINVNDIDFGRQRSFQNAFRGRFSIELGIDYLVHCIKSSFFNLSVISAALWHQNWIHHMQLMKAHSFHILLLLMPHIYGSERVHYWFSWWLVAYSAPSHYLNQCWIIVNWTPENKFRVNLNGILSYFYLRKYSYKC